MSKFLVKSFFWVTISEVIYNLSAYVIHAVMGRMLGPADYGRFGIIVTLTTMTVVLIGQSVPTAMSKYLSEIFEKEKGLIPVIKWQTIKIQSVIIGSVTVIFFLLSPVIARILNDPTLTNLFRLSSLVIPAFALASFYFYYYTGIHKFKIQAFLKTNRGILRIVFIIGLALLLKSRGLALEGAILGYVVAPLSIFFEAFALDPYKKTKAVGTFDWKKLAVFAWPVTVFLIAYQLLNTIDLYLVKGILRSDFQTGLYNAAYTVGTIPYNLFYALTIILLPSISKSTSANNSDEIKKIVSQSLRFLVMFLSPVCLLMSYFSLPIIKIFFSSKYALAAPVMSVYVIAEGFLTVFYVLTFILNGAGKVKLPMVTAIIGFFMNSVLTYFLIKNFGIMGAAAGTALMALVVMLVGLYYTHREFGYLFRASSFFKIILASAVMSALAFVFPRNNYYFFFWSIILFVIYLAALWILREIGSGDLVLVKELLSRKKTKREEVEETEFIDGK
ncbi:MAG: flippase [Candidatus Moranbacteria bacterium]|nr:flippase [Candidatus Moranbacteria bacterium]